MLSEDVREGDRKIFFVNNFKIIKYIKNLICGKNMGDFSNLME